MEIVGYTAEEEKRLIRFRKNNPERKIESPLIDSFLTKSDCLAMIERAGIQIPKMYQLGFANNNCIGCVKGGAVYWNTIRKEFPDVFERMAKQERELDVAINKKFVDGKRLKIFLDELPEDMGRIEDEPSISCGLFCGSAMEDLDNA